MATRGELKRRAKSCLKRYYWWAFLACLLASTVTAGSGIMSQASVGSRVSTMGANAALLEENASSIFSGADNGWITFAMIYLISLLTLVLMAMAIGFAISLLWTAFVGNVVRVGSCRYFMENRKLHGTAGIRNLFWGFDSGKYGNVVKVMFMRWLFTMLWSFLFIIPGIIKSYEYYLVPYILLDDPGLHYTEALRISRDMMRGHKWRLFVLQWSFIGWEILGLLCCGIGLIFLAPYQEAVYAEFYADLRGEISDPEITSVPDQMPEQRICAEQAITM